MSFFKNLWYGKPQTDNVMQLYLEEIEKLAGVMENMKNKFALYSKIVVDLGHVSLDLANGIQKFNAQLRPDYAPVQAFTHGQFTFREELRVHWAKQYQDDVLYMFEHWKRQTEAQKNTIANYDIARQHCHHLKLQVNDYNEQKTRYLEKQRPVPDATLKELENAERQHAKYSAALDNMRCSIIANQNKLTGHAGQFIYFDKAFYAMLELQGSMSRELRSLHEMYEPILQQHRRSLAGPDGNAAPEEDDDNNVLLTEMKVREMAEFLSETVKDKRELLGVSFNEDDDDEDDLVSKYRTISTPSTPVAKMDMSLSVENHDNVISSPLSPLRLTSARQKKRLSWGMSGVANSLDDSMKPTPIKSIKEEEEDDCDSAVSHATQVITTVLNKLVEAEDDEEAHDMPSIEITPATSSPVVSRENTPVTTKVQSVMGLASPSVSLAVSSNDIDTVLRRSSQFNAVVKTEPTAEAKDDTNFMASTVSGSLSYLWPPEVLVRNVELNSWEFAHSHVAHTHTHATPARQSLRNLLCTLHLAMWSGSPVRTISLAKIETAQGVFNVFKKATDVILPVADEAMKHVVETGACQDEDAVTIPLAIGDYVIDDELDTSVILKHISALRTAIALRTCFEQEHPGLNDELAREKEFEFKKRNPQMDDLNLIDIHSMNVSLSPAHDMKLEDFEKL